MMEVTSPVPTRCSAVLQHSNSGFEIVTHNSKNNSNKKFDHNDHLKRKRKTEEERKELDMKKVRYEVFKFGMSGFKPEKKEEVKVALAVKLGAKPPKKKGYNYKEYKQIKEKQRKEQLELKKLLAVERSKHKKTNGKAKKKSVGGKGKIKKDGILDIYGKPGKVQVRLQAKKMR